MSESTILRRVAALVLVGGALTIAVVASAKAPVPSTIGHQGRLYENVDENEDGTPDRTVPIIGDHAMKFAIYDKITPAPEDEPLWTETQTVTFTDGYYAVALGVVTPFPVELLRSPVQGEGRYLQITIDDDVPLTPLAKLGSVPYALVCDDATGDIHPTSVTVGGKEIINFEGKWVGDTGGIVGPQGPPGPQGPSGVVSVTNLVGLGLGPASVTTFLSPTVQIVLADTLDVVVMGHKALGSIMAGGGTGLTLNICYQLTSGGGGSITEFNATGIAGLRVPAGTRTIQALSARTTLPAGTYNVGLCGSSTNASSWNDNGWGATTAMVMRPEP